MEAGSWWIRPQTFKRPKEDRDTSVQLIDTIQDYKKEVVDEQERIVAVRFFAPWCKSCKAAHPHFKKLVSRHSPNVKFVDVPLTKETAYIHEGLRQEGMGGTSLAADHPLLLATPSEFVGRGSRRAARTTSRVASLHTSRPIYHVEWT